MTEIIPAILAPDFATIVKRLDLLEGQTDWVQLDVVDGLFAPNYSWSSPADLAEVDGKIKIEVHLMIENPEVELEEWLAVADRLVIQVEATNQLDLIIKQFAHQPIKLDLAVLADTPLEQVASYANQVEAVQFMGIDKVGFQGQSFVPAVLDKIKSWRVDYPSAKIAVDGGITLTNAKKLITAGANRLVVGSAIWQAPDPLVALKKFQHVIT